MASIKETIFLASGFVAKYPEGGGNFSVVLQWALGLRRLKKNFIWLELLASTGNRDRDLQNIRFFFKRLHEFDLRSHACLILFSASDIKHPQLETAEFFGLTRQQFEDRLAGPNTLLNLSSTVDTPLVERFNRRIFCSLDPTEVCFWMTRMEVGQSHHQEFQTIGLNIHQPDIPLQKLAPLVVPWKTFFPLVDTTLLKPQPRPPTQRFTTVGQWYWDGCLEVDGKYPDFSKKAALEKFFDLPRRVPKARFALAIFLNPDDPESQRITQAGWERPRPEIVARTPHRYYQFITQSLAEFTPVKLEATMKSGWLSDRAAAYLSMGRPVITESTGAETYLPKDSGFLFVSNAEEAAEAARKVIKDWAHLSKQARQTAYEFFDAAKVLQRILAG